MKRPTLDMTLLLRWWTFLDRHPWMTIFALAVALRALYLILAAPGPLSASDAIEYNAIARELLAGHGLVQLNFVRPPLYPLFVAAGYAIGGVGAVQAAQVMLGGATAVIIGVFAAALSGKRSAYWGAGIAAAAYPWSFYWVGVVLSETLFALLATSSFLAVLQAGRDRTNRSAIAAGALLGLAALTRANVLPLAPPLALWHLWRVRSVTRTALLTIATVAVLAPYAVYNVAMGNGLVISSSGGGANFYQGNNPDLASLYFDDLTDEEWRRLNLISGSGEKSLAFLGCRDAATCMVEVPADQRSARWVSEGLRWIRAEPLLWARLEMRKLVHYWTPWVEPRAYSLTAVIVSGVSFGTIALLAVVGLRAMRPDARALVIIIALAATITAVAFLVQLRYRFSLLDPVLLASAGWPIAALVRRPRA